MKPTNILLSFLVTILSFSYSSAQKIQMKKGKVTIDKVEILDFNYEWQLAETHFLKLGTTEEIVYAKFSNGGTKEYKGDDYTKVYFPGFDKTVESKEVNYGLKGEMLIKKLIGDGVVTADGALDEEKLNIFVKKYHQEFDK
ncbi:MAG: hypothetical protein K9J17_15730 [Flavobacteriales bacterium]|nr:hypothetical protein [Flavobacteriales bacterium]